MLELLRLIRIFTPVLAFILLLAVISPLTTETAETTYSVTIKIFYKSEPINETTILVYNSSNILVAYGSGNHSYTFNLPSGDYIIRIYYNNKTYVFNISVNSDMELQYDLSLYETETPTETVTETTSTPNTTTEDEEESKLRKWWNELTTTQKVILILGGFLLLYLMLRTLFGSVRI